MKKSFPRYNWGLGD